MGWVAVLVLTAAFGLVPAVTGGGGKQKLQPGEISLFNGRNLDVWDAWLGKPHKGTKVLGLDNDPKKVFSVVSFEGRPAIRVSGEIYGALTSKEEYENYSLRLEFKWGKQKWPPRDSEYRASGLLYHCVGKHGAEQAAWMQSLECQIMENHTGDFRCVAGTMADVRAIPMYPRDPFSVLRYDPKGKSYQVPRHLEYDEIVKDDPLVVKAGAINEFNNEWNALEVRTLGTTSTHFVNGKSVLTVTNTRRKGNGLEVPLKRGRVQLQSEGAEVYFRNIVLRPITELSTKK
jgi:hypothetical protein